MQSWEEDHAADAERRKNTTVKPAKPEELSSQNFLGLQEFTYSSLHTSSSNFLSSISLKIVKFQPKSLPLFTSSV